jgi:hypothetical protein
MACASGLLNADGSLGPAAQTVAGMASKQGNKAASAIFKEREKFMLVVL